MTKEHIPALDIKAILALETDQVFGHIFFHLHKVYGKNPISDWRNYMVWEGDNPTMLVAHIDTCTRVSVKIKQKNNVIYNPNAVLGADDRAGVYGLIKAARICKKKGIPLPTLIFTNGEERGGIGVKALIKSNLLDVGGKRLFVELDRQSCNEYVFYTWELPKPVKKYVESYGFVKGLGSYSDITDLTAHYEIPSVNLSIGYYHQHTRNERLHIDEMEFTINRVVRMLQNPISELHVCKDTYDSQWDKYDALDAHYYDRRYADYDRTYMDRPHMSSGNKVIPLRDKTVSLKQYNYETDMYEYYDKEDATSDIKFEDSSTAYYASSNAYLTAKPLLDIGDVKIKARRELLMDGMLYSDWDDVSDDVFDLLVMLEYSFGEYITINPMNPEAAFEAAWDETIKHQEFKERL